MAQKSEQIKSRERVREHGEVYTAEREVNAMMDLVGGAIDTFDQTILEPACGNGNFLAPILERKIANIILRKPKSELEFVFNILRAVSCLYGIDIIPQNVLETQHRLHDIAMDEYYTLSAKKKWKNYEEHIESALIFILKKNILLGDALKMINPETGHWLHFTKWCLSHNPQVRFAFHCVEYEYRDLVNRSSKDEATMVAPEFDLYKEGMRDDTETADFWTIEDLARGRSHNDVSI